VRKPLTPVGAFIRVLPWLAAAVVAAAALGQRLGPEAAAAARAVRGVPEGLYSLHELGLKTSGSADVSRMLPAELLETVDGDTLRVSLAPDQLLAVAAANGGAQILEPRESVRLVGVDAPEIRRQGQGPETGGLEASLALDELARGNTLHLAFDRDLRDTYGRLLCYVFLEDGTHVNLALVANGHAPALLKYPFILSGEFKKAEARARDRGLGYWALTGGSGQD